MFWVIVAWVFRMWGFVSWAEAIEQKYQIKKKAQDVANAPQTKAEEVGYWADH